MLGGVAIGVMANDDNFFTALQDAAGRSGEKFWRVPDYPEYKQLIESQVADLYNSSDSCGAIAAGMFLSAFAGDTPWLHLDIAGAAWSGKLSQPYQPKGATGVGVTTLYQLCRSFAWKNKDRIAKRSEAKMASDLFTYSGLYSSASPTLETSIISLSDWASSIKEIGEVPSSSIWVISPRSSSLRTGSGYSGCFGSRSGTMVSAISR